VLLAIAAAVSIGPSAPDISATAGLLGLVAVLMYLLNRGSLARWWRLGVGLFLLPFALMLAYIGAVGAGLAPMPGSGPQAAEQRAEAAVKRKAERAHQVQVFTTGSYADTVRWRAGEFGKNIRGAGLMSVLVLPMFMIGFWFVRAGVVGAWRENLPRFRRMATWLLPLGLAITLGSVALQASFPRGTPPSSTAALARTLFEIGSLPLVLGYLGLVFSLLGTKPGARLLSPLRHAGRMALTNYLGASIIGTFYFSGWGLGHFMQVPRAGQLLFVAVVFAAQLAFSAAWLSRFRYGPMEWLWRAITYWQLPPMRREGGRDAQLPLATAGNA